MLEAGERSVAATAVGEAVAAVMMRQLQKTAIERQAQMFDTVVAVAVVVVAVAVVAVVAVAVVVAVVAVVAVVVVFVVVFVVVVDVVFALRQTQCLDAPAPPFWSFAFLALRPRVSWTQWSRCRQHAPASAGRRW